MPLEIKIEAADKGNEIKRLMGWLKNIATLNQ